MTERRDTSLGDAVNRVPVPPRDERFVPDLLVRLEEVDAEGAAQTAGRAAGASSRVRRLLARRKGSLLAAAALAAALALIFGLAGVPGMNDTQPPAASAADRLVAAIDAGLAKVESMQGVMVFDSPSPNGADIPLDKAFFAATSAGDRLVDVRNRPQWAKALTDYRTQLAALRKAKAKYSALEYNHELSNLKSVLLVSVRSVYVESIADHTSTRAFFTSNALTRKLAFVKYFDMGLSVGLHGTPGQGDAGRVWALATQLRSLMADRPDIAVAETTYDGRPAARVVVQAAAGNPAWEAIVDKEYGVTLAVRVLAKGLGGVAGGNNIVAFHVEGLRINRPLAPGTFAIRPDYRTAAMGHARLAGSPEVQIRDMTTGAPAAHSYSPVELGRVVSGTEVVPQTVPAGFRLAEIGRSGEDHRNSVVLLYRRGMNEFVVSSGIRVATAEMADSGSAEDAQAPRIAMFDRNTWPTPTVGGSEFVRIHGGALSGASAAIFAGVGNPAYGEVWTGTRTVSIAGDLSRAELLAIAGSLRPVGDGIWGRSSADLISLLALFVALVAAGATLAAWVVARRRRRLIERPELGVLTWPLIGLALVVIGAGLSWHELLHNGTGSSFRGWNEPLGRWVVAVAVLAVAAAAWRQMVTRWHGPVRLAFPAGLLAAATLAGAVFALVYLPLEARFIVYPPTGASPTNESWLMRIISSQFSPSATTGLYISIVGALFLFVGVVMMKAPKAQERPSA